MVAQALLHELAQLLAAALGEALPRRRRLLAPGPPGALLAARQLLGAPAPRGSVRARQAGRPADVTQAGGPGQQQLQSTLHMLGLPSSSTRRDSARMRPPIGSTAASGMRRAPVADKDGLGGQHGGHGERVGQAAELGSRQQRAREAGLQRQRAHRAAQARDAPVAVQRVQQVQLPQRVLQRAALRARRPALSRPNRVLV
jgi:hypothetical protein